MGYWAMLIGGWWPLTLLARGCPATSNRKWTVPMERARLGLAIGHNDSVIATPPDGHIL